MTAILARAADHLYRWPVPLLIFATLSWAGNAVAGRLAIGHVSPFMLVFLRWIIVLALLWPIYGREVRAAWPVIRPRLGGIVLMAGLGFTGFNALFYVAALDTTAVNLGILQGSMPVFVLAGAFLVHRTPVTLVQLVGVLITLVGVVLVATSGDPLAAAELGFNRGDLAMLGACALYSYYTVALKDRPAMNGAAFFTLLALIAAATSIPLVAYEVASRGLVWPTPTGWLITLYVAVFPSCLAQIFFLRGVDLIGPGRAGVFINLVPVFAALLGVLLINEPFRWYHAAALVLVLGGIWLAQRQRRPREPVHR